jgi:hypothetical protein
MIMKQSGRVMMTAPSFAAHATTRSRGLGRRVARTTRIIADSSTNARINADNPTKARITRIARINADNPTEGADHADGAD